MDNTPYVGYDPSTQPVSTTSPLASSNQNNSSQTQDKPVVGATPAVAATANNSDKGDFNDAINFTMGKAEGGYNVDMTVKNKDGSYGMPTNYGIMQSTLDQYQDSHGQPRMDVKGLKPDYAKQIYKENYWTPLKLDQFPRRTAKVVFDYAAQSGPGQAARSLQSLVGAHPDGAIGSESMRKYNKYVSQYGEDAFLQKYNGGRSSMLANLAISHPHTHGKNVMGYHNRMVNLNSDVGVPQ